MPYFDQARFDVRCEWGLAALCHLAPADLVVIVDVLSFTTSVDITLGRGASVLPYRWRDRTARDYANQHGAELAGSRNRKEDRFSLAPSSLVGAPAGLRLVLPSPNGSVLAFEAMASGATVLAGCLRNASAVAAWINAQGEDLSVAVVPAGERWPDHALRPAIEDLLGAGAIIRRLRGSPSPEATVADAAFETSAPMLLERMLACASGRELAERGFRRDVELAAEYDASQVVPVLREDVFTDASS